MRYSKLSAVCFPLLLAFMLSGSTSCSTDASNQQHILVIEGEEDTAAPIHVVALGLAEPADSTIEADVQSRINEINARCGLAIIAHPGAFGFTNDAELELLKGYLGIELDDFESNYRWDVLLTDRAGKDEPMVWGFMVDDLHYTFQLGQGFVSVRLTELNRENLLAAIKAGNFYWGNALLIKDIYLAGSTIHVNLNSAADIQFIQKSGQVAYESTGKSSSYEIKGDEEYIRIEARTAYGKIAGSQPFRIYGTSSIDNPYQTEGEWYLGNLHAHTTNSDGVLSLDELTQLYQENGYDFLAITDHVPWTIPVESEAYIQGSILYEGLDATENVAWIGVKIPGQCGYVSIISVDIDGPGEYGYILPYVPAGTYDLEVLVTSSGYYIPADENDILARGIYPDIITIDDKSAHERIDIGLKDVGR